MTYAYRNINSEVPFTGSLLIGHRFIQSLYRHMGFHPAWKFEQSWEIELDRGRVAEARRISPTRWPRCVRRS